MRLLEAPASPAGARFPDVSGANGGMLLLRALKKNGRRGQPAGIWSFFNFARFPPDGIPQGTYINIRAKNDIKENERSCGIAEELFRIARFWQTMLFLPHGGDTGALRFLSSFSLCRVSAIPSLPFPRPAFRAFHVFSRSADFSQAVFMLFFFFICYRRFFSLSFFCLLFSHCFVPSPRFSILFYPPSAPLPA